MSTRPSMNRRWWLFLLMTAIIAFTAIFSIRWFGAETVTPSLKWSDVIGEWRYSCSDPVADVVVVLSPDGKFKQTVISPGVSPRVSEGSWRIEKDNQVLLGCVDIHFTNSCRVADVLCVARSKDGSFSSVHGGTRRCDGTRFLTNNGTRSRHCFQASRAIRDGRPKTIADSSMRSCGLPRPAHRGGIFRNVLGSGTLCSSGSTAGPNAGCGDASCKSGKTQIWNA